MQFESQAAALRNARMPGSKTSGMDKNENVSTQGEQKHSFWKSKMGIISSDGCVLEGALLVHSQPFFLQADKPEIDLVNALDIVVQHPVVCVFAYGHFLMPALEKRNDLEQL